MCHVGSPGPLFGKAAQGSQSDYIWATGGARAQARRSISDILGGLPQKNLEDFGAIPRKVKRCKWVAFGVVVKNGRDWITAAKNVGMWPRGVERGAESLDHAWPRANLRQSNVRRQFEASGCVH